MMKPGPKLNPDLHDCNSTEPLQPSYGHRQWHAKMQTDPCERSFLECSLYDYYKRHGTLEGWEERNYGNRLPCDCLSDAPLVADRSTRRWHIRRGEEPCERSEAEMVLWNRQNTEKYYVPKKREPYDHSEDPHTLYQVTFLDGDVYYGITYREVDDRLREHRTKDRRLGQKLRMDMPYIVEVLCIAPNERKAKELERLCIKSGNPWGEVLNVIHSQVA